jgi:hypothetical protein
MAEPTEPMTAPGRTRGPARPRPGWPRRAGYFLLAWITLGTTLAGVEVLVGDYHLALPLAVALMGVQGAAMLGALRRPALAYAVSLACLLLVACLTLPWLTRQGVTGDEQWPYTGPALMAHAVVLLLLAVRLPARTALAAGALSAGASLLLHTVVPDIARYLPTAVSSAVVFGAATLLGVAARRVRTRVVPEGDGREPSLVGTPRTTRPAYGERHDRDDDQHGR